MAAGTAGNAGFMEKIIEHIKGSGDGDPTNPTPLGGKIRFSMWYSIAAMLEVFWFQSYTGASEAKRFPILISSNRFEMGKWEIS